MSLASGAARQSTAVDGPLVGVRVLDLTQGAAGPYCTRLLALYGADVAKVERPGIGDCMRWMPPFVGDQPGLDRSLSFLHLNANKRSVELNLQSSSSRALFLQLVRDADIVVESFRPG